MHITDAQLALFKEQGFLIVENFLTADEKDAALAGFFHFFAPPYDEYIEKERQNDRPRQVLFPWDHSGLNHAAIHPDLVDAAERILDTREIRLCESHVGNPRQFKRCNHIALREIVQHITHSILFGQTKGKTPTQIDGRRV